MLVVIVGWVLFRSATLRGALAHYAGMIGLHGLALSAEIGWQLGGMELAVLAFAFLAVYAGPWLVRRFAPAVAGPGPARQGCRPPGAPATSTWPPGWRSFPSSYWPCSARRRRASRRFSIFNSEDR